MADKTGTKVGGLTLRMRNVKDSSAVYMTGELSQPCSNSGMIHHECGGWFLASVLSPCTYSWKSTCQVDAMHEQNSKATVFAVDVEMAVVDKAVCGASSIGACKKMDVNPTSGVKTKCDPGQFFFFVVALFVCLLFLVWQTFYMLAGRSQICAVWFGASKVFLGAGLLVCAHWTTAR